MARKFEEKAMTANVFREQFQDLMRRAMSENPVPLAHIIFELEIQRAKCENIFLAIEAQKEQRELDNRIIPATTIK